MQSYPKMEEAGEYPQLAKSIFFWLNYQKTVSRSDVLLESAIRFPLAEFIERRYKVAVDLEAHHPYFDRLRVDFSYRISERIRYVEVKYLHDYSDREAEFKRYFDDLVRLALLDGINYFILCGPRDLYENKILKERIVIDEKKIPQDTDKRPIGNVTDNKFEKILPLHELGGEIDFNPFEFYPYIGPCDIENRQIPHKLENVHVRLVAQEDDKGNSSQVVYIWRVTTKK